MKKCSTIQYKIIFKKYKSLKSRKLKIESTKIKELTTVSFPNLIVLRLDLYKSILEEKKYLTSEDGYIRHFEY